MPINVAPLKKEKLVSVTFLCHGLYTTLAHGLGFTKINLGHTLGYQLGVHFDNFKGWVWCILLFLMVPFLPF
jgi:hypothetical protein